MERINEQAARWTVREDAGSWGTDEQQALDAWLNADPRHRGAYVRARAQWVNLDRLAALNGPVPATTRVEARSRISRREILAASVAALTAPIPAAPTTPQRIMARVILGRTTRIWRVLSMLFMSRLLFGGEFPTQL